jgi:hypothetical protein
MSTEIKKADIREYQIRASSTDTFGRLICNSRHHHFVVDGPAQNGCPGEALTPPEIFLRVGAGVCERPEPITTVCHWNDFRYPGSEQSITLRRYAVQLCPA